MRPVASVLALVSVLSVAPATAMTLEEAARTNLALAVSLCLAPAQDGPTRAAAFRAAGFAERVDRSAVNSDTTHFFTAPADTVTVELYYGEMPQDCRAKTGVLGVSEASRVIDQIVPQLYPQYQRKALQGPTNPATGQPALCVRYEQPGTEIPHVVGVSPGQDAAGCIENGTSVVFDATLV